jgi:hypothetical protein
MVIHQAILGNHAKVNGEAAHTLCNNAPSVAWQEKGSTATTKPAADLLSFFAVNSNAIAASAISWVLLTWEMMPANDGTSTMPNLSHT